MSSALDRIRVVGPGSQDGAEALESLLAGCDMVTWRQPHSDLASAAALAFLDQLLARMRVRDAADAAAAPLQCSVADCDVALRDEINELLGVGEVSISTTAPTTAASGGLRAEETAFTGVWRVSQNDADYIEAGRFPAAAIALAQARPPQLALAPPPPGLMNAPALRQEILDRSANWRSAADNHVINLSLLPATPQDLAWLDEQLGRGGLAILSRGYGNCRVTAAAAPQVWWVQYFNNMEKMILNSIEICDLPVAAAADEEDIAQSVNRLDEWLQSLREAG